VTKSNLFYKSILS